MSTPRSSSPPPSPQPDKLLLAYVHYLISVNHLIYYGFEWTNLNGTRGLPQHERHDAHIDDSEVFGAEDVVVGTDDGGGVGGEAHFAGAEHVPHGYCGVLDEGLKKMSVGEVRNRKEQRRRKRENGETSHGKLTRISSSPFPLGPVASPA